MTSGSYDTFYYDDEQLSQDEVVDVDYSGPRKIQPENYMEARFSLLGHSPWIPMIRVAASASAFYKNT